MMRTGLIFPPGAITEMHSCMMPEFILNITGTFILSVFAFKMAMFTGR